MSPLRALFLVNHFAPESGASANRIIRLVRLLPAEQVQPSLLTLCEQCAAPPTDPRQAQGLPGELEVTRRPCLDPVNHLARRLHAGGAPPGAAGRLLLRVATRAAFGLAFPDPLVLWAIGALPAALRLVHRLRPDVLVASIPSHSCAVFAATVSQLTGVPFVLDFRDCWTLGLQAIGYRGLRLAAHAATERRIVARAAAWCGVTERHVQVIAWFNGPAAPRRRHVVPNAVDLHLAADVAPLVDGRFVVVHAGGIMGGRTLAPLLRAMATLRQEGVLDPSRFQLKLFGQEPRAEMALAAELGVGPLVHHVGFVPRSELLRHVKGCRLTVSTQPADFDYGLPSKVFESVAMGCPVLCLTPHGSALEQTIHELGMGWSFDSSEQEGVATLLRGLFAGRIPRPTTPDPGALDRFRPESTARAFAAMLRDAVAAGDGAGQRR